MFDRLTAGLTRALEALSGRGYLSEDNIADTVREVRLALLDADVALPVVKSFTEAIKSRAVGVEVTKSLTPGQAFIKVVHEELVRLMGEPSAGLNLRAQRPVVVMLAGLQGAGKTTTVGKLARWLMEKQRKKVLLVSTDVYRPAAIAQLETLAGRQALGDLHAHRAALDRLGEALHHRQGHVGVEQRETNLADGIGDIVFAQVATARKSIECAGQPRCQTVEHR